MAELEVDSGAERAVAGVGRRFSATIWIGVGCLVACVAMLAWMAGKGGRLNGTLAYMIADIGQGPPYRYKVSFFDDLWHPLFVAMGGSIRAFRVAASLLLGLCGGYCGCALARLVGARQRRAAAGLVLALAVATFWILAWDFYPAYNMVNLGGLLLFFGGLLAATPALALDPNVAGRPAAAGEERFRAAPAVISGVGLALMALVKITSAVAVIPLGALWLLGVRPRSPWRWVLLAGGPALALWTAALLALVGGIGPYWRGARMDLQWEAAQAHGLMAGPHGLGDAFLALFRTLHTQLPLVALALFVPALVWSGLVLHEQDRHGGRAARLQRVALYGIPIGLAAAIPVMGLRDDTFNSYYYIGLLLTPLLFSAAWTWRVWLGRERHVAGAGRVLAAAAVLAAVPVAFGFGSNANLLFFLIAGSVFWAAAMFTMSALLPAEQRPRAWGHTSLLIGLATVGLVSSLALIPLFDAPPSWRQTARVEMGSGGQVEVPPDTAAYLEAMRTAARENGFVPGMPLLDFTDHGIGVIATLGAALNPLVYGHGPLAVEFSMARRPNLAWTCTWMLTEDPPPAADVEGVLRAAGIDFPGGYAAVAAERPPEYAKALILWRPLKAGCGTGAGDGH